MDITNLLKALAGLHSGPDNCLQALHLPGVGRVEVYPNSVSTTESTTVFVARSAGRKWLWAIADKSELTGETIADEEEGRKLHRCALSHENAVKIRKLFDFTRPILLGTADSFGYGDRLGIANPAHVRAAAQYDMRPIFAQQSIRELTRTQRSADEVMDAATWAVLQEGYRDGFGADADHLKTTDDIDRMVRAGFTFFTIDPGDYVINEADRLLPANLAVRAESLAWQDLADSVETLVARYDTQAFQVSEFTLQPTPEQVLRAVVKYCGVVAHTVRLYRYLKSTYPHHAAEFELSVDETEAVTSPFEHYFIANELKRLGVELVSLAPRFVGEFEKGIDFKGDLEKFKSAYLQHVRIAEKLGPYKISIHSGSDKFAVYEAIGSLHQGNVHVKTAGTSYLEALRTVAACEPVLFRKILDFARGLYEEEKRTYHVSADLKNVAAAEACSDEQLLALFDQDDARQVLHVTFGKVLTIRTEAGALLFKDDIMACLQYNEKSHYENLVRHFKRHLQPFA